MIELLLLYLEIQMVGDQSACILFKNTGFCNALKFVSETDLK